MPIDERNRLQIQQRQLATEMRQIATGDSFEEAIKHFTVVVASSVGADAVFQMATFRALREFLSDPTEHLIHQLWADVDFDLPGGAR